MEKVTHSPLLPGVKRESPHLQRNAEARTVLKSDNNYCMNFSISQCQMPYLRTFTHLGKSGDHQQRMCWLFCVFVQIKLQLHLQENSELMPEKEGDDISHVNH